jgi:S-methylmethionine-dependent homocysteine/selenocysteine methylase
MTQASDEHTTMLLDGGMGMELSARGVATSDHLWAARALLDAPETVRAVHHAYLAAGADVITTNTYSTAAPRLERAGAADHFVELNELAARLAAQARDEHGSDVLIAGSLPPLGETYRPDKVGDDLWMVDNYRAQAEVLAPHVDVLLAETLSTGREARAAASAAVSVGRPVWIAMTVRADGRLLDGTLMPDAVSGMNVNGVLANCSTPEAISAAMPDVVASGAERTGGYANGFVAVPDGWDVTDGIERLGTRDDIDPDGYARVVAGWLRDGANLIGGCCRIGPPHIAALRSLIDAVGP